MPLRKPRPRQASIQSDADSSSSSLSIGRVSLVPPSKRDQAAMLAQQLGSERSWADQFLPELPAVPVDDAQLSLVSTTEHQHEPHAAVSPTLSRSETAATPLTPSSTVSELVGSPAIAPSDLPPTYDDVVNSPSDPPTGPLVAVPATEPSFTRKTPAEPVRTYTLHETYKSISGVFTFYDHLELSSSAGSISVTLDPQPGDKPAVLRVNAKYGSIKITVTDEYLKRIEKTSMVPRPWDVVITATTGTITTKLPIGQGSIYHIEAQTGSIKSTFFAASVGRNDEVSKLTTISHNGSQKISIESYQGKIPITNILAKHHAKGHGSLKVEYPKVWQGKLHALSAGHGNIKVSGDALEHTHFGDKEKHSWRGTGQQIELLCDGHGGAKFDGSS